MKKAEAFARRALEASDQAPYGQLVLGAAFEEKGHRAEARKAFETFVKLCPGCRHAAEIRVLLRSGR